MSAIILYYKPTCPFSRRVLDTAEVLGLTLDLRNISGDAVLSAELVARGGKRQTPYLIDARLGQEMYESGEIIKHLEANYQPNDQRDDYGGLRIHQTPETCDGCE